MKPPANLTLTERDLQVILFAHSYGGCTADHIRARFFPTKGARSACYERVSRLVKAGYLEGFRLPSVNGVGSGKAFLTPGPKARPLVSKLLGIPLSELGRKSRVDSPLFIAHHLALCDFRLALELATEISGLFKLVEWITDGELKRSPIQVKEPKSDKLSVVVPDALFTLSLPDGIEQTFFVENDMGTLAPKRFKAKLRAYIADHRSPILFVAPDPERQSAIIRWALEEARDLEADPTIFWITTKDQVCKETVLSSPVWQVVGGPRALAMSSLVPDPQGTARDANLVDPHRFPLHPSEHFTLEGGLVL